jgi:hypothetical protein
MTLLLVSYVCDHCDSAKDSTTPVECSETLYGYGYINAMVSPQSTRCVLRSRFYLDEIKVGIYTPFRWSDSHAPHAIFTYKERNYRLFSTVSLGPTVGKIKLL